MDAASSRDVPIPVYAEMSSINPTFLFRGVLDQKPAELATGLHGSVTLGVGQFCTNPGLVFVEAGAGANVFQEKLEALVTATPAGTMLTSDLCASYAAGVDRLAKISGVRRLASGKAAESSTQGGAALFMTDVKTFLGDHALMDEVFGPSTLIVQCSSREEMVTAARRLEGQLTATIHATSEELAANRELVSVLTTKAGRLLFNGFPTGVEVCHSMTHGGPYPATSDGRSTSVGTRAIERFIRPLAFQDFPDDALPDELKDSNPLMIPRLVNGKFEAV
jgi:NADP-dependent aldehyde dehydrogenase